jgi:hypothetical protein
MSPTTATSLTHTALGFRAHSGWAAVVAVASPSQAAIGATPVVVDRRRIDLIDQGIPAAAQPYHAAAEMESKEAGQWVARCAHRAELLARDAIRSIIDNLVEQGCRTVACGIVLASGKPLPALAAVLASHALIHTAEGELFREALRRGSEHCSLQVTGVKERELYSRGAMELGMQVETLNRRVAEMGRLIGAPWSQDQKSAALAAWLVLAATGRGDTFAGTVEA